MQALHRVAAPLGSPPARKDARLPDDALPGWPSTPTVAGCSHPDALTHHTTYQHSLRLALHSSASPPACSADSGNFSPHLPPTTTADSTTSTACDTTTAPSTPSPRPATVRSSDTPSSLHPSEHSTTSLADHVASLTIGHMSMSSSTPTASSTSDAAAPPPECLAVPASWSGRCCWRSMPPSVITGLMGTSHLRDVLGHLPMDARHWNQLEQLLEEGRLEMFLIMVYNYLHYEDPTKWNKLEKHVMNPAGYLNKNIGQKVGMLAVCADMVDAMHVLRSTAPETASNVDGRTLQYMFDNLSHSQIRSCCEYLHAVFDQTWPLRCENPRMLLHAKVKSFVAQAHQYDQQQAAAVGHYPATVPPQAPQPQQPPHKLSLMYPPSSMGHLPSMSHAPMSVAASSAMLYHPHHAQHQHMQQPSLNAAAMGNVHLHQHQHHQQHPQHSQHQQHPQHQQHQQQHQQHPQLMPKATTGYPSDMQHAMVHCR